MKFKSPPVNSLSLDFLTEFSIGLEKLENNRACRGVILTSVRVVLSSGCELRGNLAGTGAVPLLMFGLLAPWSLAREGREAALIGSRRSGSWKGCALSSLPSSSGRIATEYSYLSLKSKLLICKLDASLEIF